MTHSDNSYRSSLGRVKGLGSSHSGVHHWWLQRLTAVSLVPLGLWLLWSLVHLNLADYHEVRQWLGHPIQASLTLATVWAGLYHGLLGMQVIVEDYIHCKAFKLATMVSLRLVVFLCAVIVLVAIFSCIGAYN